MNVFHMYEVVDMGIEKEKKRRDFYSLAEKNFQDKEMKDLFRKLRDWEETHIKKFTAIRESLSDQETAESYPGEMSEYMQSLVDVKLYSVAKPEEFSKNVKIPLDAIGYGISFEKDAILLFNELLPIITQAHKEVIKTLINEEKQHIIYLTDLREKISSERR